MTRQDPNDKGKIKENSGPQKNLQSRFLGGLLSVGFVALLLVSQMYWNSSSYINAKACTSP